MKQYENETFNIERNFINLELISQHLQCSICSMVFNNPMRLDCGHTFCYECIMNLMMKYNKICPICRDVIREGLISRDLLAYNIINELEVTCNNEMKGCPWKGSLIELKSHLKSCNENIDYLQVKKSQGRKIVNENIYDEMKTPNMKELIRKRGLPKTAFIKRINDIDMNYKDNTNTTNKDNSIKRNIMKMFYVINKDFDISNNVPLIQSEQKAKIEKIFSLNKNI